MTTLATDGITLAADGQISCGDLIEDLNRQKVFRLNDGTAIAFAGCLHSAVRFMEWVQSGSPQDLVPSLAENFGAIRINGTSTVLSYDNSCHAIQMPTPYAEGTGKHLALGAMLAGKTPVEAVKIAAQRDMWTGGKIRSVTVKAARV